MVTKNYSKGVCSGIECWRVNSGGLGLVLDKIFKILRDGMA
jgi:hypothetical protein